MTLRVAVLIFLNLFVSSLRGFSQASEHGIVIQVREPAPASTSSVGSYVNGYRSSISGATIDYHSSLPDVDSALLVRGQNIAPAISWQTDPLPHSSGGYSEFIWLAGIECAGFEGEKQSHSFDFSINGQHWFTFKNAQDETAKHWKVTGKDGAELSFDSSMTDKAGDLFGYMVLKLPAKNFEAGKPLTLTVRGDNSGSPDWFMTFQHPFDFIPRLRPEPALLRNGTKTSQSLRMNLDNLVDGRTIQIQLPGHDLIRADLRIGSNIFQLPVPVVTSPVSIPVIFRINDKTVETSSVSVTPVRHRDIYLLSYSHNDIGYTDLQPNIERKQWNNLDQAMKLIRDTRNNPEGARYKWNLETIWALETYLKQASPAQREEFFADVREGSIGLNALFANMLTGLANSVEMSHYFDLARMLRSEYHIPLTTAATSDVPGFSWGIVSALAQSGIKYFATAPNSGDRIGYTLEAWGDKPFYWESQSGQERVLTWMAGASYASFHQGTLSQLGDEKIMKLVRKLDESHYPYDILQLPYTIGDNGGPDPALPDAVKSWNERYVTPHLILATQEEMFEAFEKRYGSTLPVKKGDFTPYWEDGAFSSAAESVMNRSAADRLIQGETLWSMLSPESYPVKDYVSAWRNVSFYDEHTWGAHNSIEEPDLPFVKQQWDFKRQFAVDADRQSRELMNRALNRAGLPTAKAVDIYNTNSWPRTDIVFLTPAQSQAGDRVADLNGQPVPSQRLSTGELAVLAENLQPFSALRLLVQKGESFSEGDLRVQQNTLENDFIALSMNPQTGAIDSIKPKNAKIDLVDHAPGGGLNRYLYVRGTDPAKAEPLSNVRIRVKESGKLLSSLLVEGDAPGANRYATEIRMIQALNRVDIITLIDKQSVREKEGVHIAFPFAIPDGQLRYDVANAIVRPEIDQLTGSCKNFFSVQSWVDISNSQYGVTWATANAPLIEIGSITAEQPWMKSISPSTHIYSYVMNNYWHTNYKADQEGPVTFAYSIAPHGMFNAADAAKFGTERRQPLLVAAADPAAKPLAPLFRVSSSEILVSALKPVTGGHAWLAYLYNPSAAPHEAAFRHSANVELSVRTSNAAGDSGPQVRALPMPAFGSAYVLIEQR